jgi:hypothetical protein
MNRHPCAASVPVLSVKSVRMTDRSVTGNSELSTQLLLEGVNMQQDNNNEVTKAFQRVADTGDLVSEEDIKNKVVLPILRALGYDDNDFNYERRTGRGYVDVVVDHFPIGIVVESKAPRKKLDNFRE